ncbi:hypothetical protein CRYUN_Cryun26dG0108900 [Craigia yunnanensis]
MRFLLVDTLALIKRLEAKGLPSKQAEAITVAITKVLNDSLENVSLSVVFKAEMQKISLRSLFTTDSGVLHREHITALDHLSSKVELRGNTN